MDLERLKSALKRDEDTKLKPYRCSANKLTIGTGRNIEDNGISQAESDFMLANDIARCVDECVKTLPFFCDLDDVRQEVILNMCFNMGIGRLLGFKDTFSAISRGDYEFAAVAMLDSKWAAQVGARATRLADAMRSGEAQ